MSQNQPDALSKENLEKIKRACPALYPQMKPLFDAQGVLPEPEKKPEKKSRK